MFSASEEKASILKAGQDTELENAENRPTVISCAAENETETDEPKRVDVIPAATVSHKLDNTVNAVSEEPEDTTRETTATPPIRVFITLDCCPCKCEEPAEPCCPSNNKKECPECECPPVEPCDNSWCVKHFPCLSHLCECFAQTHPR
jgi:hypothetical protein